MAMRLCLATAENQSLGGRYCKIIEIGNNLLDELRKFGIVVR